MVQLIQGDCLEKMKELTENSVDAIVTDSPYGLKFMGKKWDYEVPSIEIWKEALRVLKPGGHLLSFGGTRTYHRLVVNIEDAGFEIRDCIQWLYGSGFPKSTNVALRIDKESGVIGNRGKGFNAAGQGISLNQNKELRSDHPNYVPPEFKTESAKQWQGWGTALKPANEPIVVARKPLEKGLTVAENVIKWGCGAINIDGSRIGTSGATKKINTELCRDSLGKYGDGLNGEIVSALEGVGRWPANIILDEVAAEMLDEQSGVLKSGELRGYKSKESENACMSGKNYEREFTKSTKSEGGASRFFYVAKASKSERNAGLEGMPLKESGIKNASGRGFSESDPHKVILNQNHHPTVKPIKLMQYLINLVTPPNGTVLDPFMGSGSTGVAAKNLNRKFIGIELSEEYFEIAKNRINKLQLELSE